MGRFFVVCVLAVISVPDGASHQILIRDVHAMSESQPLFLTPLIKRCELEKAKRLSFVQPFPGFDHSSYSGLMTIDDTYDSNVFFWYFLSKSDPKTAPVLLWMTGGPGISALSALFGETGPFYPDSNLTLNSREFNWVLDHNVIFVDNPVGAGFSFSNSTSGYAVNTPEMAFQVSKFLEQFFVMFSEFKDNDFYIVGKSFSGKVAMALAAQILNGSESGQAAFNLKGVISVCGFLDPVSMSVSSDHYYDLGLIDERQRKQVADQEDAMVSSYQKGSLEQANMEYYRHNETLTTMTGLFETSNLLFTALPRVFRDYETFVGQSHVRQKIHVGHLTFSGPEEVIRAHKDNLADARSHLQFILNNPKIKVLLISGQLDLIVPPSLHRQFVTTLNWPGSASYVASRRVIYRVDPSDEEVAGYVQQHGQLTDVMLRSAGHMIAHDQPRATLDVLKRFIRDRKFA